ncbi:hypothetical protein F5882DRAFT_381452 [Hyaloscypha sp. PMI_1271]|nr:hypothetical protein F5882DRAFT_381452 [Hyaloscypha sp. PMI_1271]
MATSKEIKPLNLIMLIDGIPLDDVKAVLLSATKKLDKLDVPLYQEALEELNDGLSELIEGGVRDIVDTITWTSGSSQSEGGIGLTGDGILKVVLGTIVKRLNRRRASGEVRRTARS